MRAFPSWFLPALLQGSHMNIGFYTGFAFLSLELYCITADKIKNIIDVPVAAILVLPRTVGKLERTIPNTATATQILY